MKHHLVMAGIALVVALVVVGFQKPVQNVVNQTLGAVSSPDIMSPYFSFGGVRHWAGKMDMRSASSTLCSIQSPAATSTLVSASASFTAGVGYATSYDLGVGDNNAATSTVIGRVQLVSGTNIMGHITATSTALNTTVVDGVMRPNQWVNFRVATATVSTLYAPVGTCSATFREI